MDALRVCMAIDSGCIRPITEFSLRRHSSATLSFACLDVSMTGTGALLQPAKAPLTTDRVSSETSQLQDFEFDCLQNESRIRRYLCLEGKRE